MPYIELWVDEEDIDLIPLIVAVELHVPGKTTTLHRVIGERMGITTGNLVVDHKDRNPLNCSRSNLRPATRMQNSYNRRPVIGSQSRYKGVQTNPKSRSNPWRSSVRASGVTKYLGSFPTEEAAARAYDQAARELHGEFAVLNFPD